MAPPKAVEDNKARESHRETRGLPWLDVMMQDLSFTFRTLRRDRAFTIVAVLILALGIGANVAVFSVVNTILLRPLPFRDSQQLVRIVEKKSGCRGIQQNLYGGRNTGFSATEPFVSICQRLLRVYWT